MRKRSTFLIALTLAIGLFFSVSTTGLAEDFRDIQKEEYLVQFNVDVGALTDVGRALATQIRIPT
jgi:hypothetical protein